MSLPGARSRSEQHNQALHLQSLFHPTRNVHYPSGPHPHLPPGAHHHPLQHYYPPYPRSGMHPQPVLGPALQPQSQVPKGNRTTGRQDDTLLLMDVDQLPAKPRSPYLTAADYVFYLRRQVARERGFEGDPPDEGQVELPKLTELLRRLRDDLRLSFASFVDDFVGEPNEGVSWMLDLLKVCHNRKSRTDGHMSMRNQDKHQIIKRAMADEYECLLCLRFSTRSMKTVEKMVSHRAGLSTVATCIMSDFTKSRMIALQLLTRVCELSPLGFSKVLEAMSSLRLIYGESVRFKFLVAILNGNASSPPGFEFVALSFLNAILKKCPRPADRVRLQCELEEAGFHIAMLEGKLKDKDVSKEDKVWEEIQSWKERYLDVTSLLEDRKKIVTENAKLREELELLRKALKKLEMDKISLMQIERELKDRCEEYNQEMVKIKKSDITSIKPASKSVKLTKNNKKVSASDDSDSSDAPAPDSGRCSFMTDGSCSPTDEADQPESEEIFIDIPTICPPAGFRSLPAGLDSPDIINLARGRADQKGPTVIKADVKPGVTDLDLGIEWQYPSIPQASVFKRTRSGDRFQNGSKGSANETPRKSSQRSRSEDRTKSKCRDMSIEDVDVKYVEATGFFYKPRTRKPLSELFPESFAPVDNHTNSLPANLTQSSTPENGSPTSKHFPLPASYRNHFILRGHSNCDRYSGMGSQKKNNIQKAEPEPTQTPEVSSEPPTKIKKSPENIDPVRASVRRTEEKKLNTAVNHTVSPHGTISALVHKEITEAVRQISGWL